MQNYLLNSDWYFLFRTSYSVDGRQSSFVFERYFKTHFAMHHQSSNQQLPIVNYLLLNKKLTHEFETGLIQIRLDHV